MIGVIFAAAVDDPETGYALTMDESMPVLDAGRTLRARWDGFVHVSLWVPVGLCHCLILGVASHCR